MAGTPDDPLEAGLLLAETFEEHGVAYALGGALAYGLWGVPRATVDVDVNVFVTDRELDRVFEALESLGISLERSRMRMEHQSRGMFTVHWKYRIDIFTPSIAFSWEAKRTRSEHEIEGRRAFFLSAEALAVFKLLFFRPKDIVDLERLVAVQGDDLDRDYIRRHIVEMMDHDDERVARWDAIVLAHG